jgi:hypothetical protein
VTAKWARPPRVQRRKQTRHSQLAAPAPRQRVRRTQRPSVRAGVGRPRPSRAGSCQDTIKWRSTRGSSKNGEIRSGSSSGLTRPTASRAVRLTLTKRSNAADVQSARRSAVRWMNFAASGSSHAEREKPAQLHGGGSRGLSDDRRMDAHRRARHRRGDRQRRHLGEGSDHRPHERALALFVVPRVKVI